MSIGLVIALMWIGACIGGVLGWSLGYALGQTPKDDLAEQIRKLRERNT